MRSYSSIAFRSVSPKSRRVSASASRAFVRASWSCGRTSISCLAMHGIERFADISQRFAS
jgi:hypothetical protein